MGRLVGPHGPAYSCAIIIVDRVIVTSGALSHVIPFADVVGNIPGAVVDKVAHLIGGTRLNLGHGSTVLIFMHGIDDIGPAICGWIGQHAPVPVSKSSFHDNDVPRIHGT